MSSPAVSMYTSWTGVNAERGGDRNQALHLSKEQDFDQPSSAGSSLHITPMVDAQTRYSRDRPSSMALRFTRQPSADDEHMLRRKTPNGTLSAAYDARPQDLASVPPATKLLKQTQSFNGAEIHGRLQPNHIPHFRNPGAHGSWAPYISTAPTIGQHRSRVPTVLQPVWNVAPGPTAFNPVSLYGPYWPDGSFAPYRPASRRHHQSQLSESSSGYDFLAAQGGGNSLQGRLNHPVEEHNLHHFDVRSDAEDWNQRRLSRGGRERSTGNRLPDSSCVSHRPACNFRDKALMWAQQIYADLLKQLQRTSARLRGRYGHGQPRSLSQPNIYPTVSSTASTLSRSCEKSPPTCCNDDSSNSTLNMSNPRRHSHASTTFPDVCDSHDTRFSSAASITRVRQSEAMPRWFATTSTSVYEQAKNALEMLHNLCRESQWTWIDGMLLGGCLAYGLDDHNLALNYYRRILSIDACHVEAISNLAATFLALNRRDEAEQHWHRAIRLRPSYFEAAEHLIGLLCANHRSREAVNIIDFIETSLLIRPQHDAPAADQRSDVSSDEDRSCQSTNFTPLSEHATFDFEIESGNFPTSKRKESLDALPGYGSSGYRIPGSDNGRMLALIHAKGNLLYTLGDIEGASRSFENAVLISTGKRENGVRGLIDRIAYAVSSDERNNTNSGYMLRPCSFQSATPILLPPDLALRTAGRVFPPHGDLPGLSFLSEGMARKAALSTTSNSLLSLAKVFQDSLSSASSTSSQQPTRKPKGVGDILALYYLSLSLQPSPSTANNVGILLASVQQHSQLHVSSVGDSRTPSIPGVVPGSGVALALAYYNYGLNLDSRHAHLFTNLGSLLKDLGQLNAAIQMYEQAVSCDGHFDIALANLANAVKDQGRISDAIGYYKRAVKASPEFAEAVCGLANALNSVCDWAGRGGVILERGLFDRWHVDSKGMIFDSRSRSSGSGLMKRVVDIVAKQLEEGAKWGQGTLHGGTTSSILAQIELADSGMHWTKERMANISKTISSWGGQSWEGAKIVRVIERATKRAMHRWYRDRHIALKESPATQYLRPVLPATLLTPGAPTVLPFHTFTCPLPAKDIRMISQRNALRISCSTLRASWLPATVYPPPAPPVDCLNIGYISSDFNNHPLAHLMQSVFGLHDTSKAKAHCYATTPSDKSTHRLQIEKEAPVFHDASSWSSERLIQQILNDNIHILVNLNGYTRGARNEIFAARPAPIQMSFMGFAGTLGAEWCDYLLADEIAIPPETLRPWRRNVDIEDQLSAEDNSVDDHWVYSENIIYCKSTFFCCDHRQSNKDAQLTWPEEQKRRWKMRKELFPNLADGAIIMGNFNQLYKIDPTTFRTWLRILDKVPHAILWLLRFPDLGESNLKKTARAWAGEDVASRIWFTDVAPKGQHISRARICDLFLDTPECNAHTTAADILWSSTPLLTLPRYRYKMCSRMAASILMSALPQSEEGQQAGRELVAANEQQYEEFAIKLATGLVYDSDGNGSGRLVQIRRLLYESRYTAALFDTKRWVRDLENAYTIAWAHWVDGKGGDIYL